MRRDLKGPVPRLLNRRAFLRAGIGAAGCVALGLAVRSLAIHLARARLSKQACEPPPDGMVLVPAGYFWMGSDDPRAESDERPRRRVFLPAFYIDRYEVTNRQFQRFKPDHQFDPGQEDLPATFVFKAEAEAYCRFVGKRLPTSAEWEKAARGTDGRAYPWGSEFQAGYCNLQKVHTAGRRKLPGGSFPNGVSPYGCHDMCGNVWEWVSDVYADTSWWGRSDPNPCGIIRGGAYSYGSFQGRASYQGFEALNATCHDVGFRGAMDAVPKRA